MSVATKPWTMFEAAPGRYKLNAQAADGTFDRENAQHILDKVNAADAKQDPLGEALNSGDGTW